MSYSWELSRLIVAPYACSASLAGSGGSGWPGSALSLLAGGWRTPREDDLDDFYPLNYYETTGGLGLLQQSAEAALYNLSPVSADVVTLAWSLPRSVIFDHISVYRFAGASVPLDGSAAGLKLLPAAADRVRGEIPGNATGVVLPSGAQVAETRTLPILNVNATTGAVDIPGNRAHSFLAGSTQVNLAGNADWPDGAYTVQSLSVVATPNGECTRLVLPGWTTGVGGPGGTCQLAIGPIYLDVGDLQTAVALSLDLALRPTSREQSVATYDGWRAPVSYAAHSAIERLDFELAYGGIDARGLHRLNKFADAAQPVRLHELNRTAAAYASRYYGTLSQPGHPGGELRYGDSLQFSMEVARTERADFSRPSYDIVAADSGSDYFEVAGHCEAEFTPGTAFIVRDSTGNDAAYCVGSAAYQSGSHRTRILPTTAVPDGTDDGFIEVQQW